MPSKEYLQNVVDNYGPVELASDPSVNSRGKSIRIKDIIWSSYFRTHSAVADTFFACLPTGDLTEPQGAAILLVGDAAYIHSPASGQGTNLGLRDAISLSRSISTPLRLDHVPRRMLKFSRLWGTTTVVRTQGYRIHKVHAVHLWFER